MIRTKVCLLAGVLFLVACGGDDVVDSGDVLEGNNPPVYYSGETVHTMLFGSTDNVEAVKIIPGTSRGVMLASKARKLVLVETVNGVLEHLAEKTLFLDDGTESELTNLALSPDGTWGACTRTIIEEDKDGNQIDCGGEVVLFQLAPLDDFGKIIKQVEVGPMPDFVAISDDGLWLATANERDGPDAWGKCLVAGKEPSVSIISLEGGPGKAKEIHRVVMIDGGTGPREPESLVFSKDNDLVVATLQDSHELVFIRISQLDGIAEPTSNSQGVKIVRLPDNSLGAGPWPDGIDRLDLGEKGEFFISAGEWNDTFAIVDNQGVLVSNTTIEPSDIPESFPRVVYESYPYFSPDSVVTFAYGQRHLAAFTLRHSGALAIYDVSNPHKPTFVGAVALGKEDKGNWDKKGSTVRPEGLDAAPDGSFILVANEGESSLSLVLPVDH